MADGGEPMIGFLRGDELQNLFGKVPKGQKTEKHDAEQRRRLLARKAKKKTIPPKPKYRVLERLETQLKREGVIQERAERRGRSLYAQLELEPGAWARACAVSGWMMNEGYKGILRSGIWP